MYKNAVLSEILYCMGLRLKGGVRAKRVWNRRYRAYLESILDFMELSAVFLETRRDLTKEDVIPVVEFVNANVGRLFAAEKINIENFCDDNAELVLTNNCAWDEDDDKIIAAMRTIISECRRCLNERPQGYKDSIARLLHAYHNLPRAYLSRAYSPDIKSTFLGKDYSRSATSKSLALEYAGI